MNRLKEERLLKGLTQEEVAAVLDRSARTVANLEKLPPGDPRVARYLRKLSQAHILAAGEHESDRYSWKVSTYDLLFDSHEIPNRADRVSVFVELSPTEGYKDAFVRHGMRVIFENFSTGKDGLLIDAVGNPDAPEGKEAKLSVTLGFPWKGTDRTKQPDEVRASGVLFKRQKSGYPHVICYQLKQVATGSIPKVELFYDAEFAARIGDSAEDAMGFALPADLLVGEVAVTVTFREGLCPLCPNPGEASTRPFPIRRYARAARPDDFEKDDVPSPISKEDPKNKTRTYSFRLLRPKPGYGYVISWTGLRKDEPFDDASSQPTKEKKA